MIPVKIISVFILCLLCVTGIAEGRERGELSHRSSVRDIDITRLEKKIHTLVNRERAKRGLSALLWGESLHKVARKYSQDMVERNFFSHHDPDDRSFHDRYKAEGIDCKIRVGDSTCLGAENIAQGSLYSSSFYKGGERFFNWNTEDEIAESVVKRWMSSRAHRENILTPYFKRQGIGVAFSEDGRAYITENFC